MTGNEFRSAIEMAGLTINEFAETMGVHRSTISRIINSDKAIEPYWAYALAGLLSINTYKQNYYLLSDFLPNILNKNHRS